MITDTNPDVERRWLELIRQTEPRQKIRAAGHMYMTMCRLAESGLRERYPGVTDKEIRRRLADLLLGPELAEKAYGPLSGFLHQEDGS